MLGKIFRFSGRQNRDSCARRGFTLVELLIVIGILAILSTATVVVLNPAELLAQGRDSTRLSDIQALGKALSFLEIDCFGCTFGSPNTIYISAPDNSPTCDNLDLPDLPGGWSYACVPAANIRKIDSTGWVPVDFTRFSFGFPLSSLPVDPVNDASHYYQYIAGGSWKLQVVLESQKYLSAANSDGGVSPVAYEAASDFDLAGYIFPSHWVKVPGNSAFGTSDFFVMKYEAKCIGNNAPLTAPDTGYHTYSNSGQACTGARYIASAPTGYPIANISHNTAKTYCESLGAHLLTNDEWMTIARNAEQVNSNWSGSSPGSGYLFSGHNDNTPALALEASSSDTDGYLGTGNASPSNQRRTLTLSNGSVIWDLAGNVWDHVQRSTMNQGDAVDEIDLPPCSNGTDNWTWCQYSNQTTPYISSWTDDVVRSKVGPSNDNWYSSQGVGQVYTWGTGVDKATTVFLRGGDWYRASDAGAFALGLGWAAGSAGVPVGFRCAR